MLDCSVDLKNKKTRASFGQHNLELKLCYPMKALCCRMKNDSIGLFSTLLLAGPANLVSQEISRKVPLIVTLMRPNDITAHLNKLNLHLQCAGSTIVGLFETFEGIFCETCQFLFLRKLTARLSASSEILKKYRHIAPSVLPRLEWTCKNIIFCHISRFPTFWPEVFLSN